MCTRWRELTQKAIKITNHPDDISLDMDFGPGIANQKAFIIEMSV